MLFHDWRETKKIFKLKSGRMKDVTLETIRGNRNLKMNEIWEASWFRSPNYLNKLLGNWSLKYLNSIILLCEQKNKIIQNEKNNDGNFFDLFVIAHLWLQSYDEWSLECFLHLINFHWYLLMKWDDLLWKQLICGTSKLFNFRWSNFSHWELEFAFKLLFNRKLYSS